MSVSHPAASSEEAVRHFAARLSFETDVSDVAAQILERGEPGNAGGGGIVVVDTRSAESWDQGHIPGGLHLPTTEIAGRAATRIPRDVTVVVHCWGPGCNGATKAALLFAELGFPVNEMIGGVEYWAREGLPVETAARTVTRRSPDPLTAPVTTISCDC
ncbi:MULTISPECIES: rhodanese-like domain-containing protein [unclassified Spirillospora]|uniref:rhodanese-like domain-containing protein n=1 Tax=unclassified Spirillospora TaxID=2642701 RepID=UPI00371BBA1D